MLQICAILKETSSKLKSKYFFEKLFLIILTSSNLKIIKHHFSCMQKWSLMVKALDSQWILSSKHFSWSKVDWSAVHLPRLIKWVPGIYGNSVVKSKLSPCSGSVALRQLNSIHKKGHKVLKVCYSKRVLKL